jgi:ABC-type lipoprotein export system ATPase subunit
MSRYRQKLEEPTGALDSKSTEEIMSLLAETNKKGITVMLVTHDVRWQQKQREYCLW